MHSRQCLLSTDPATCLLTQPFACLPSHLPVDPISTFFSSNVVPGHRRASARTSLINSAHPGPARLARALECVCVFLRLNLFAYFTLKLLGYYATPVQVISPNFSASARQLCPARDLGRRYATS